MGTWVELSARRSNHSITLILVVIAPVVPETVLCRRNREQATPNCVLRRRSLNITLSYESYSLKVKSSLHGSCVNHALEVVGNWQNTGSLSLIRTGLKAEGAYCSFLLQGLVLRVRHLGLRMLTKRSLTKKPLPATLGGSIEA